MEKEKTDQVDINAEAVDVETVEAEAVETANKDKTELWNPNAAANWSFLFTMIFGACIHARNWRVLGKEELAKKSMYWMYGGIGAVILYLLLPESGFDYVLLIGPLLAWYFTMGKSQSKYLKANNIEYKPKSWAKPIGIGIVALILFCGISAMLTGNSDLEKSAIPVVNEIAREHFGPGAAKCIDVEIVKELKSGYYKATAYLDNGKSIIIIIQERGNDQIYVSIPEDQ